MIPVLFIAGMAALAGWSVSRKKGPTVSSGDYAWNPAGHYQRALAPQRQSFVAMLEATIGRGAQPSPALIQAALQEAISARDYQTVQLIRDAFFAAPPPVPAMSDVVAGHDDGESEESSEAMMEAGEQLKATCTTTIHPATPSVPAVAMPAVPLADVDAENWQTFAAALKTKDVGYSSERQVGAYEQNKRRLKTLGIDDVSTESAQYAALCSDVADYAKQCDKLIRQYTGDIVQVNGEPHPVTRSGVLALLKAAGPKGAESWLANAKDRTTFPHTTETFLRGNQCF